MGMVAGIIGLIITLVALNTFIVGCYDSIETSVDGARFTKHLGKAFFCLLGATLLKVVDVVAHFIVPVPKDGYWGAPRKHLQHSTNALVRESVNEKYEDCVISPVCQNYNNSFGKSSTSSSNNNSSSDNIPSSSSSEVLGNPSTINV